MSRPSAQADTSNQNDSLYGNDGNDTLFGNQGDDYLDGGEGADLMVGGSGDDTYVVDNVDDTIIEHENEGIDTVISSLDYTLGANLENLTLSGSQNLNGTGNSENNIIIGNSANNVLTGLDGNDIMYGAGGNDTLYGGNHNDILIGGAGNDLLYGEDGDDTYIFSQNDGVDTVNDSSGTDMVLFSESVNKSDIAFFMNGNNLVIDYGTSGGEDKITIQNQTNANSAIERFELSDGSYITNADVNQIIQNMTAYAANNSIEFTNINSVKNNDELMAIVASSWNS